MKIGVFGQQGGGKTFLSMLLARMFQKQYPQIQIYTNINTDGENINVISDFDEIPLDPTQPKILIIDEAMFTIDSRSSSSKQNVTLTKFFAFLRKLNFVMTIFATHRYGMLDVRIRDQLDYVIMSRRNTNNFDYLCLDVTTGQQTFFQVPKTKQLFQFTNFNTLDFPNIISTEKLQQHSLFQFKK